MISKLAMTDFEACLHEHFQIHLDDEDAAATAVLVDVATLPDHSGSGKRPFSIVLRTEEIVILPQRIYPISHDRLGQMALFLVPIGPDSSGMRYEAIFN